MGLNTRSDKRDTILQGRKTAVLMDNNVLACDHGLEQIERIIELKVKVDFNQGIDARLITPEIAQLLSRVKWLKPVRLACDSESMIEPVRKAVEWLRWFNCKPTTYFCYILVKDIPSSINRIRFLKGMNIDAFAQPLRNGTEPVQELKDFARWVNHKAIYKSVPWEKYKMGVKE